MVKLYGGGGLGGLAHYQTGVVVSADGLIATIDTLVLEQGEAVAVMNDGSRRSAKVVGSDPITGIALLRAMPPLSLAPFVKFRSESSPEIGQSALVFANVFGIAAGDEPVSLITGVVGGLIPPADSVAGAGSPFLLDSVTGVPGLPGGLVLAADGTPIGLMSREVTNEATGLIVNPVISADVVADRIEVLLTGAVVERSPQPAAGVTVSTFAEFGFAMIPDLSPRTPPYVDYVRSESLARQAGLAAGDLIVSVGDDVVSSQRDLLALISPDRRRVDSDLQLTIKRGHRLVVIVIDAQEEAP
ncbi:S1C family serine protease [Pirellulimonas nuda]|uniref:S1C family serine protease n=1 Tax=Pirellulimonas nuda TaxID=2528009 RepID=UPI0018D437BA|nr:S1C family serine protease [Pirellulimonas nuda]